MTKTISLMFATISTLLLAATAISIAHSLVWTIIFISIWFIFTGFGFIYKAKQRRKNNNDSAN